MKTLILFYCLILILCIQVSCNTKYDSNSNSISSSSNEYEDNDENTYQSSGDIEDEESSDFSSCKLEDGTYSATVDYNNPNTGYSSTYTLDVEVQDCQVIQINFPNDGYLDEDHISYADIDEDGSADVDGEYGKTYQIQIEN